MFPTILPYLEKELKLWYRAKEKSIESYENDRITFELHYTHLINLTLLIGEYERAIKKLKL